MKLIIKLTQSIILSLFILSCFDSELSYEDLHFKDKESISLLTGITDFPDYEYENNSEGDWTFVRYRFTNNPSSAFYDKIEAFINQEDNYSWFKDTLWRAEDQQFYGSEYVYVLKRGWDGQFIKAPNAKMPKSANVEFYIGKKAFACNYVETVFASLDEFGNRDSISAMTGVTFPNYENVYCKVTECGEVDGGEDWIIKLKEKPSEKFIQQIRESNKWNAYDSTGIYRYDTILNNTYNISITIDKNSRIVKAKHSGF